MLQTVSTLLLSVDMLYASVSQLRYACPPIAVHASPNCGPCVSQVGDIGNRHLTVQSVWFDIMRIMQVQA